MGFLTTFAALRVNNKINRKVAEVESFLEKSKAEAAANSAFLKSERNAYLRNFQTKVVRGSLLSVDEVLEKIDIEKWDKDLEARANSALTQNKLVNWVFASVFVFFAFMTANVFMYFLCLVVPVGSWFVIKDLLIRMAINSINNEFRQHGWEAVDELMSKQARQKLATNEAASHAAAQRLAEKAARAKSDEAAKFGIAKDENPT
jgi:hypothetical protein